MKNLYLDSGYVNMDYVTSLPTPFIFVVGGRGTGKTYGALKTVIKSGKKFLYMRRTQTQADIISKPEFSPFKSVCEDLGIEYKIEQISKYNTAVYLNDTVRCYTVALSTITNLRGFDMSDCDYLIYDEFIPEPHERLLKNEGEALLNAYETINRNRELKGKAALKCICLSNSNNKLKNPIFEVVGVADKVMSMYAKNKTISINAGLTIILLNNSPISNKKSQTALYKVASEHYKNMALSNKFDDTFMPQKINLKEYKPIFKVGIYTVYQHKTLDKIYATTFSTGSPKEISLDLYFSQYYSLVRKYDMLGNASYDRYTTRCFLLDE